VRRDKSRFDGRVKYIRRPRVGSNATVEAGEGLTPALWIETLEIDALARGLARSSSLNRAAFPAVNLSVTSTLTKPPMTAMKFNIE
jgi:hypothetical protein